MKLGFIGCGNMANAIIGGIVKKGICPAENILGADPTEFGRERTKKDTGINVTDSNIEVVEYADVLFLSVKPQFVEGVIDGIKDKIRPEQLIISIVAGKTVEWLENQFGKEIKLVRTMPNTPALVLEGMTAAVPNKNVNDDEKKLAIELLSSFSQVEIITENLIDAFTATCGSSPAYVFMMIEAMADAAVSGGIPRAQAYKFAAQAVLGSAKMVLETGKHPADLKDMVCSPAGSTIEAVRTLDGMGFRSAIFEAMKVCEEVSSKL